MLIDESLPIEILQSIFLNTLPVFPNHSEPRLTFAGHPNIQFPILEVLVPLILSQVSKRWRTVAQQLAPFWTFIYVDLRQRLMSGPMIQTWLARSQQRPLTIVCFSHPLDHRKYRSRPAEDTPSRITQTLELLLACASRWQDVFLGVRCADLRSAQLATSSLETGALRLDGDGLLIFPRHFRYSTPHLRTLHVRPGLNSYYQAFIDRLLSSSTLVETVDLHQPTTHHDRVLGEDNFRWGFTGTWHRLTSVRLSNIAWITTRACLRALENCPLEDMALQLQKDNEEAPNSTLTVTTPNSTAAPYSTLRHLRSLTVRGTTHVASRLLDSITTPGLHKLTVDLSHVEPEEDLVDSANALRSSLSAFMGRSRIPEQAALRIPRSMNVGPSSHLPYPLHLWNPVSDITAAGFTRSDLLTWLTRSSNSVHTLSVTWVDDHHSLFHPHETMDAFTPSQLEDPPPFLPNLKALSVDLEAARSPTPALQKLRIRTRISQGPNRLPDVESSQFSLQLSGFLQRSNCSFTHLHLEIAYKPWAIDLIELLSSNTTTFGLKTLVLEHFPEIESLCKFLLTGAKSETRPNEVPALVKGHALPRLTHLVLTWNYQDHYQSPNGTLARMLRWRFEEAALNLARIMLPEVDNVRDTKYLKAEAVRTDVTVDEKAILALEREGWNIQMGMQMFTRESAWFSEAGTAWGERPSARGTTEQSYLSPLYLYIELANLEVICRVSSS
ncbi:hypothetical protein BDV98DRAFT_607469 [Pterulicium gracile]|uniref:F-box domain-containing protein n=1 Tax=Pterulicium gracile TaxID=1884261 RepID=A0A5C3Q600_9AGAR|nr:hypothetical protein BDV98DRAFT_607469 [Pterula gracilis]